MAKSTVFVVVYIFFLANTVTPQNISVMIPLNQTTSWGNKEVFNGFFNLTASSTLQVDLGIINPNVSYIIFQVHSHLYNVTLYNNTYVKGSYVTGTNVGMYSNVKPKLDTYFIINPNIIDLKILVSIHGYAAKDPIPGGCNMEFPLPISPFMKTAYNKHFVLVDAAAAKDSLDKNCNGMDTSFVNFYKVYLPERSLDADTYFEGIQNMLTMDRIQEFGEYIFKDLTNDLVFTENCNISHINVFEISYNIPDTGLRMRRMLSAYPETGAVYVAIAFSTKNTSAYSVYVPTYSYACDPLVDGDCDILDDFFSQMLCASLVFVGLFMCFFGHRFFKTEMFIIGFSSGIIITYILISLMAELDRAALLGASVLSGVCFGAIWLLFWWFYGIPIFAVFLSTMNVGFLFAAIIYYGLPGGLSALEVDLNFWTLFILITVATSLMLVSMTFLSNILCCAILGAYATIFPMDYYMGSNLRFIIINTIRRAIVPHFNRAVLSPPFQWRDAALSVLCVCLSVSGALLQRRQGRGRAPFPPPPRSVQIRAPILPVLVVASERTPLLA